MFYSRHIRKGNNILLMKKKEKEKDMETEEIISKLEAKGHQAHLQPDFGDEGLGERRESAESEGPGAEDGIDG